MIKNPSASAGDGGLTPGLGISPGGGNGYSLQYSCPENPMDREAWQATVYGVSELDMTEQLTWSLSCPKYCMLHTYPKKLLTSSSIPPGSLILTC